MVRTRSQVKIFKARCFEMRRSSKIRSYESMKQFYRLPYRSCLGLRADGMESFCHPCWSAMATLEQIRKQHPKIPLASNLFCLEPETPLWRKTYWQKNYLVPVLTQGHIQLLGIQYTSPRSIQVLQFQSKLTKKDICRAIYRYLPWVRQIHLYPRFGAVNLPQSLKSMCVPITAYVAMNIDCKKDLFLQFLSVHQKLNRMTPQEKYDAIMGTWQHLVRPE